jgi:SOS-response transcriptional repressor LexA
MSEVWTPEEEAERLRNRFTGINKKDFAERHKIPGGPSMLSQHLSGHRPINLAAAIAYAKGFGVPLTEISPRLAMVAAAASGTEHPTPPTGNTEPGPDLRGKVPLISWIRAGEWCEASDPFHPGDAERWLDCPVSHSKGTFALRVRGDSMTAPSGAVRTYPEGCIIFVDPERLAPVNGDRVVACLEGSHEVTFKVYKNEDGRQWLMPLNPQHEPIREPFRVLGTVLGKWEDG